MLAGESVARVSAGASGCTTSNLPYSISYGDNNYTFWDTPGLNENDQGTFPSHDAVQNLLRLVKEHSINLLIYCIRGRLVDIIRVNYDLFWKIICGENIPIVLVVTGLEDEQNMDVWWPRNQKTIRKMKMSFAGHACITSWKGKGNMYEREYEESAKEVWRLVMEHSSRMPWTMPPEWPTRTQQKIEAYERKMRSRNGMLKSLWRLFW